MLAELEQTSATDLAFLQARLHSEDRPKVRRGPRHAARGWCGRVMPSACVPGWAGAQERTAERLAAVVKAADAVLAVVDKAELRKHNPKAPVGDTREALLAKQERDIQRSALQDALLRKGLALADTALGPIDAAGARLPPPRSLVPTVAASRATATTATARASTSAPATTSALPSADAVAALNAAWSELEQWAEVDDPKYLPLRVAWERANGRPAAALRHLQRLLADSDVKAELRPLHALRRALLVELGWRHWDAYEAAWGVIRFPPAYARF
jgi:hypothetical protein